MAVVIKNVFGISATNCRTNRSRASASLAGSLAHSYVATGVRDTRERRLGMKDYLKILFSVLAAAICTVGFAADKPGCQKTGKNCPMNDNKACNCGKSCTC
jgi:hypothetical protein